MMTERIFKSMMNRLPAGEYDANDTYTFYEMTTAKSYKDCSKIENSMRRMMFCHIFEQKKYGFEYMFKGRIRYIGTNDLHTLIVEEK